MSVSRLDRLTRHLPIKTERTDEGYLKVTAPIARVGIYTYHNSDGSTTKEFVSAATLQNQDSLKTLELKPVTNDHPREMVNTDNAKALKVGSTGETFSFDGQSLIATFTVTDSDAIKAIEAGKVQLSPAYTTDVKLASGTHNGESYDGVQTNRRYNHLALVDAARGGDSLKIKLDRYDGIQIDNINSKKGDSMPTDDNTTLYHLDGANHSIPVQVERHLAKLDGRVSTLTADVAAKKTELDTLQAKYDASQAEVKKLSEVDHSDAIDKAVAAKFALHSDAKELLGEDYKADMADSAISAAIIAKAYPEIKLDGRGSEAIEALVESATLSIKKDAADSAIVSQRSKTNADGTPRMDSRSERIQKQEQRWRNK